MIKYNKNNTSEVLTFYKYSNIEGKKFSDDIYQYIYDKYNIKDYEDARVILFFGKKGEGKTTAINAFFNVIKGIKIEDKFRFILLTKSNLENNKGIHLYYIKRYDNTPIIIINMEFYGQPLEDNKLKEAFIKLFKELIDHINIVCFVSKITNSKLAEYEYFQIKQIFPNKIMDNIIFLTTFANFENMNNEPAFIKSMNNGEFKNIKNISYFSLNGQSILNNNINNDLAKYSYNQFNKFYEEKVKKSISISTKIFINIFELKNELKNQTDLLSKSF